METVHNPIEKKPICIREKSTYFCPCAICDKDRHGTISFDPNIVLPAEFPIPMLPENTTPEHSRKFKKKIKQLVGNSVRSVEMYENEEPYNFIFTCGKCSQVSNVLATVKEIDGRLEIEWSKP